MHELIGRLVTGAGVDRAAAQNAVAVTPDFMAGETPENTEPLPAKLSGAEESMRKAPASGRGPDGVNGAGLRMMETGLGMGQVQSVTREFMACAREKAGAERLDKLSASIPGLA